MPLRFINSFQWRPYQCLIHSGNNKQVTLRYNPGDSRGPLPSYLSTCEGYSRNSLVDLEHLHTVIK